MKIFNNSCSKFMDVQPGAVFSYLSKDYTEIFGIATNNIRDDTRGCVNLEDGSLQYLSLDEPVAIYPNGAIVLDSTKPCNQISVISEVQKEYSSDLSDVFLYHIHWPNDTYTELLSATTLTEDDMNTIRDIVDDCWKNVHKDDYAEAIHTKALAYGLSVQVVPPTAEIDCVDNL